MFSKSLFAILVGVAVAVALLPFENQERLRSTDLVNFYAAGKIVAHGQARHLYERPVQEEALRSTAGISLVNYYLHPPFEAAIFVPLTLISLPHAYVLWTALNCALLVFIGWIMAYSIPRLPHPFMALSGFAFIPILNSLSLGQDSLVLLLSVTGAYALMRRQKPFAAGVLLSLMAVKFQYLCVMALLLWLDRRRRIVTGIAAGTAVLLVLSTMLVGLSGLMEYVSMLHNFSAQNGYGSLRLERMVSWRGFLAGIGTQKRWIFWFGEGLLFIIMALAERMARSDGQRMITLVTACLILSPYAHFADASMLFLPVMLSGQDTDWLSRGLGIFLFLMPAVLLLCGGHYVWNSDVYLMFTTLLGFVIASSLLAQAKKANDPAPPSTSCARV